MAKPTRLTQEMIDAYIAQGLWDKKFEEVRKPSKVILVAGTPAVTYNYNYNPFQWAFWHDRKEPGWANVAFVDNHIGYIQVHYTDNDPLGPEYTFQRGKDWTFIYND